MHVEVDLGLIQINIPGILFQQEDIKKKPEYRTFLIWGNIFSEYFVKQLKRDIFPWIVFWRIKGSPYQTGKHQPVSRAVSEAQSWREIFLTHFSCLDWPPLPFPPVNTVYLHFILFLTDVKTCLSPPRLKVGQISYLLPARHSMWNKTRYSHIYIHILIFYLWMMLS